MYLKHIAVIQR